MASSSEPVEGANRPNVARLFTRRAGAHSIKAARSAGLSELPDHVERYMQGKFKVNDFTTHTMGLDDIREEFDPLHQGESSRTVIRFLR